MTANKTRRSSDQNHTLVNSIKKLPTVSFIIPTLNAQKFLDKCLYAIRSQNYPQKNIEIVIADGGSVDQTINIAKKYKAKIIHNKEVLHEPGKHLATQVAKGDIYFFTDADNILATVDWLQLMTKPYIQNKEVVAIQPQTEPPPDWNSFDRYLGILSTDPFSWFVYQNAANPKTFSKMYHPLKITADYIIYKFTPPLYPLIGLSQGFGTVSSFKRSEFARNDDILSGIEIVNKGGLVAYVPKAAIYHYHVASLEQFLHKYSWRVKNNIYQKIKGMGLVKRKNYLTTQRKIRIILFPIYSMILPFTLFDAILLYKRSRDIVVFWHPIACFLLTLVIVKEYALKFLKITRLPTDY